MNFPEALRERRASRRLSQLELAIRASPSGSRCESAMSCCSPLVTRPPTRRGNLVGTNAARHILFDGCAARLLAPPANAFRIALHPDGMARRIVNFPEWARHVLNAIAAELVDVTVSELRLEAFLPADQRTAAVLLADGAASRAAPAADPGAGLAGEVTWLAT